MLNSNDLFEILKEQINNEIEEIRNILINSDSVICNAGIEPITRKGNAFYYRIPTNYSVQIDYNKLAMSIYNAGYRKNKK